MTIDLGHIRLVTYLLYMYAIFEQKSAGAILKSFYINLKYVKKQYTPLVDTTAVIVFILQFRFCPENWNTPIFDKSNTKT